MTRSAKKGPYVDERIMKKVQQAKATGSRIIIKTWNRSCDIHPDFVGFTFAVHNGRQHMPVFVTENMVGHKLGEFAPTRKWKSHGGKLAKEQK